VQEPLDPFAGDPTDPSAGLDDDLAPSAPLTPAERQDVVDDLADLEVYEALLGPRGVRGLVVDCEGCQIPHFFGWDLLRANLRHLLDVGDSRVHEPAYDPDPAEYVSWDYARGFVDGLEEGISDGDDGCDATESDATGPDVARTRGTTGDAG